MHERTSHEPAPAVASAECRAASTASSTITAPLGSDLALEVRAPADSTTGSGPDPRRARRRVVALTFGAWVPMLGWFAAVRPGLMSADSLAVWEQANGSDWVDVHPPLYTAATWVSAAVVGDPSLVALGQSLVLAASIVAVARATCRLGAPKPAVVVATALVAASPMVGAFSMSLWKDVPYTAAVFFAGARVIDLVRLRDAAGRPPHRTLGALWLWLSFASLLRQNGIVFGMLLLLLLLVALRRWARAIGAVAAGVIAVVVVSKAAVYPLVGVKSTPKQAALSMFLHDIAAVASAEPAAFSDEDRSILERVAPFERWRSAFAAHSCSSANWEWSRDFDWTAVEGDPDAYFGLWRDVASAEPGSIVSNRLCAGAIAWRPDPGSVVYSVSRGVDGNPHGLVTDPLVDDLYGVARDVMDATDRPPVQWLLWQAPPWVYLGYTAVAVAAYRRRQVALLAVAAPMLALQGSVLPFAPTSDARYMFAGLIFSALILPTVASHRSEGDGVRHGPTPVEVVQTVSDDGSVERARTSPN